MTRRGGVRAGMQPTARSDRSVHPTEVCKGSTRSKTGNIPVGVTVTRPGHWWEALGGEED